MQGELPSQRITEGVIWKQLLFFFFPILLGSFFQQMYNTVDTIIVGRFVGTRALAAVGSTSALLNLMNGFFIGLSTGATVLLSQFYGAKSKQGVQDTLHTGVALSLVLGAVVMTLGYSLGPKILGLMNTPESCMDDAVLYIKIYFAGAIASMLYNMGAGILRAMGDSRKPTMFLMAACGVNIVLDILCVVVLKLGVAGAAIATVFSQVVSAGMVTVALLRQPEETRLSLKKIRFQGGLLKRILYVGVPAGLQFVTFDLANLLIQSGINSFGDVAVAAWTAYVKTDSLTWMISGAFGVSVTTFVGQNFGAQKYDRIRQSVWVCMGMSVVLTGAMSALVITFRPFILGIYTTDPAVIRLGAYVMAWTVPFNVLFMPVEVFAGAMLEEEARLQTRYYELSAQAADYQDDTQGYYDACADGMASLLAELIAVRQEIAEYCGYSDYPQFAEDFYFYRDYTAAEEEQLLEDIRRELVPLYRELGSDAWEATGEYASERETLNYLATAAEGMGGTVKEAHDLMKTAKLYDTGYGENKYNSSFEQYLTSYQEPFIFMNATLTAYDKLVLAHEFGHFCNDYASYGSAAGVDVSEFFSTGMEYLSLCYGGEDLTRAKMADSLGNYVEQGAYASFERQMYSLTGNALSAEGLYALYEQVALDFGFDSVGYDRREFVDVTHFYTNPMYVFSYVVSNDAAMQLYQLEQEQRGAGLELYEQNLTTEESYFLAFLDSAGLESPFEAGRISSVKAVFESVLE